MRVQGSLRRARTSVGWFRELRSLVLELADADGAAGGDRLDGGAGDGQGGAGVLAGDGAARRGEMAGLLGQAASIGYQGLARHVVGRG
jgi:hypothetical protein